MKAGGEGDDRGWDGRWHHWLSGHEFEQALGDGDGQGSHDWVTEKQNLGSDCTLHKDYFSVNWDKRIFSVQIICATAVSSWRSMLKAQKRPADSPWRTNQGFSKCIWHWKKLLFKNIALIHMFHS